MSRPLLAAALALAPATCSVAGGSVSAAATGGWPRGEVVFRPECFGPGGGEYGGSVPVAAPPVATPAPAPTPAVPAPAPAEADAEPEQHLEQDIVTESTSGSVEVVTRRPALRIPRVSLGGKKKSAPSASAAPPEVPPPARPPEIVLQEEPTAPAPDPAPPADPGAERTKDAKAEEAPEPSVDGTGEAGSPPAGEAAQEEARQASAQAAAAEAERQARAEQARAAEAARRASAQAVAAEAERQAQEALKQDRLANGETLGDLAGLEGRDLAKLAPKPSPDDLPRTTTLDADPPALQWGGTVHLSNDDSMSLASAQRVLWAAMNRARLAVREIRPHELLNYFSFDAVEPDADQLFDVLASAEQDGDRLAVALAVSGATPPRQPLDLTLVLDRSCSMADEGRMDFTRRGLERMGESLRPGDRLDVVLFDDRACVPLENYVVGRDDPTLLAQTLERLAPEGSTDVGLGLRTGYAVAKRHLDTHGRNRRMMVVTDALLNTGDVDPDTVSEIGRAFEADGIRLTGVGVGREFRDEVLDQLTEKGKGAYVFLGSEAVVDRVFGPDGFDQLVQTIAHDVRFALKLPPSLAMERFYGEEASTVAAEIQPVNYYAGTTQLFLQDLALREGEPVRKDPLELQISWRDAVTGEPDTRTFRTTVGTLLDADPHNVRKGLALMAWTDLLTADAMGADPCGDPLATYAARAARVPDDAEVAFVNGLVQARCGTFDLPAVVSNRGVPFKVRVDADIPIRQVALSCAGQRATELLSGADVVAMFTVTPGVCDLTLTGRVDMTARVEVPVTGGDLRCVVRGGRVSCS